MPLNGPENGSNHARLASVLSSVNCTCGHGHSRPTKTLPNVEISSLKLCFQPFFPPISSHFTSVSMSGLDARFVVAPFVLATCSARGLSRLRKRSELGSRFVKRHRFGRDAVPMMMLMARDWRRILGLNEAPKHICVRFYSERNSIGNQHKLMYAYINHVWGMYGQNRWGFIETSCLHAFGQGSWHVASRGASPSAPGHQQSRLTDSKCPFVDHDIP